jgi:exosortase/archaeosortase family protein
MPHSVVEVADNCSGFATLYAGILAAVVLAQMTASPLRRAAVLLAAVPLALLCNFVRVTVLVLLVHQFGPSVLETWVHPASGMALFVLVIGGLILIGGRDALHGVPGRVCTPISDRFAVALFAVSALALVPVVAHTYLNWRVDDCANPTALVPPMAADGDFAAHDKQVRHDFVDVYQWREGKLAATGGVPELSYIVIRSYDPKQLYYRGTRRMWKDVTTTGDRIEWLDGDGGTKVPIVRSSTNPENPRAPKAVIAALLVYDDKPVETGWLAQLRAAPRQLFGGSRPMTFFAVRGDVPEELVPATEKRAQQWLLDSWRNYGAICRR